MLSSLASCVVVFFTGLAAEAVAGSADIEGTVRYEINGNRITVEIGRIANNTSRTTGTLYVTVRMTSGPRVSDRGYRVARHRITGNSNGQLRPGHRFSNIRWTLDYSAPPAGTYYVHFYTSQYPDEDTVLDSSTFQRTITSGRDDEPGGDRGDDHGSTRGQATSVRLNTTTRGALERSGDVDYFRVEVTQTGQLRIATSGSTDADGNLQTSRTVLAGDDNAGEGANFRIVRQVPRGTYYIAVFGGRGRTATGAYILHVSFTPGGGGGSPPSDDHGNQREGATRVGLGTRTTGALEQPGDVDYFRIAIERTGQLRIATSGRSTDTVGNLQDARRVLARNDNVTRTDRNFRIVRQVPRGTYYVAVYGGNRRTATGPYTLHVGFTPGGGGGPSDIREHGDSRGQATVVRLDATLPVNVRGALERRGDRDYFRVIVPATGELRVATSGDTDTYGYLGGTSGPWLSRNDDNRGDRNFRLVRRVSRGTYYVAVVGGEGRTATGEYTLHVNFSRQ